MEQTAPRSGRPAVLLQEIGRLLYETALTRQRAQHDEVASGRAPNTLLLVEHDPVVTLGRRGDRQGIRSAAALERAGVRIVATDRGGNVTYHGPGQLVAYPIVQLQSLGLGIRDYVCALEGTVIRVLAEYGIEASRDSERRGVITAEGKIASIGVRVARGVTMHGVALNVHPDMAHWRLIDPCGDAGIAVTAISHWRRPAPTMAEVRVRFVDAFAAQFNVHVTSASVQAPIQAGTR